MIRGRVGSAAERESQSSGPSGSRSSNEGQRRSIQRYYDETWWDYRVLWLGRKNLAIHFGQFDDSTRGHAEALLNANRALADRAGVRPGDRVLDAGCGVGGSSIWLARERGAQVVGIALGETQVARAWGMARGRGCDGKVRFLRADFTRIPFADASFDVVWALESLCHASDKAGFYREAARVLRPGGRLVVADFMRVSRAFSGADEAKLREWCDGWSMPDLDSVDEHRAHARSAGFGEVRIEDVTERVRPSLRRLYRIAWYTYPLAAIARFLGVRSGIQHGNVIGAIRQYQTLERGMWAYCILSAIQEAPLAPFKVAKRQAD